MTGPVVAFPEKRYSLNLGVRPIQSNFTLIDLVSQRHAVREFLCGLEIDAKVEWIASQGTIRIVDHAGSRLVYVFESRFGFRAGFFFDESGDFVFLGDHHTFR